jgi:conjugative transfer region protein TrbK
MRPLVSRIAGFSAAAAAVVATAVHLRHDLIRARDHGPVVTGMPSDSLARELDRCRLIGMAAKDDADCEAAWAENRRRFFAPLSDHSPADNTSEAEPKPEAK